MPPVRLSITNPHRNSNKTNSGNKAAGTGAGSVAGSNKAAGTGVGLNNSNKAAVGARNSNEGAWAPGPSTPSPRDHHPVNPQLQALSPRSHHSHMADRISGAISGVSGALSHLSLKSAVRRDPRYS